MLNNLTAKIITYSILPIAVLSVQRFSSAPIGNTFTWWLVEILILLAFWRGSYLFFDSADKANVVVVKWYLIWNLFSIFRGFVVAENYWDWKNLVSNAFVLLIPLVVYVYSNKESVQATLSFYVKYALLFTIVVFPFLSMGSWGWYLFPISLLMLFFPALKFQWKLLVLGISLVAILGNITVRSYIFKYGLPMLLLFFFYMRRFPSVFKIMQTVRWVFLLIPWIFFFLGVSGTFNVFKIDEYIKGLDEKGADVDQPLSQDSRTFLYEEVLHSANKHNYYWFGRSPARGNETVTFADLEEITGRKERIKNEANILNVFTWTGIVGVILFFLVFYKASYLAINKTNNTYSKLIGLFVAFRWAYSWVEDYYSFDANTFIIWMMIALCFSDSFRRMSDDEVALWVRAVFEKKYYVRYKKYVINVTP